jgi:hypothetical protein
MTWIDVDHRAGPPPSRDDEWELWSADADSSVARTARIQHVASPSVDPRDTIAEVRKALADGAPGLIRILPGTQPHQFPLEEWALAPLPAVCEREGIGLAVDYASCSEVDVGGLARFAREAPEVAILAMADLVHRHSAVWRLFDRCPNVLAQVRPTFDPQTLAAVVDEFGAHRFVFGSSGHRIDSLPSVTASLSEASSAILHDNARCLDDRTWRDRYL